MKIFLLLLVFIFNIQSWTKADDIRDFEIEGMSIGDSLLDFFNKNEIEKNKAYFYKSKEYYAFVSTKYSSENYDGVQFHVRDDDDKFVIEAIEGMKNISNFNECNEQKNIIVKELSSFFTNAVEAMPITVGHIFNITTSTSGQVTHYVYPWAGTAGIGSPFVKYILTINGLLR